MIDDVVLRRIKKKNASDRTPCPSFNDIHLFYIVAQHNKTVGDNEVEAVRLVSQYNKKKKTNLYIYRLEPQNSSISLTFSSQ